MVFSPINKLSTLLQEVLEVPGKSLGGPGEVPWEVPGKCLGGPGRSLGGPWEVPGRSPCLNPKALGVDQVMALA